MTRIDLRQLVGPPLTTEELGAALGLSRRSVLEAIDAGELHAVRMPPAYVQYRIAWHECRRYAMALGLIEPGGVFMLSPNGENGTSRRA